MEAGILLKIYGFQATTASFWGVPWPTKPMKMKNIQLLLTELASLLLALLFGYTAISKVYDWHGTRNGLYNQIFPAWMAEGLLYGLPLLELIVAGMLVIPRWRRMGFLISLVLLSLFSIYVAVVMTGIFGRIPCNCGGVIGSLGWGQHLLFNLVFLGLAGFGVWWREEGGSLDRRRETEDGKREVGSGSLEVGSLDGRRETEDGGREVFTGRGNDEGLDGAI